MLADSVKNIFAVKDLRNRVLFTLGLLAVYRIGGHIPTPGVNPEALRVLGTGGVLAHVVRLRARSVPFGIRRHQVARSVDCVRPR